MPQFLNDQFNRNGFINGSAASPTGGAWSPVTTGFGTTNLAVDGASLDFGNGSGTPYFVKNSAAPGNADQTIAFEFTPTDDNWVVFGLLRVSGSDSAYQFAVSSGGGTWYTRTASDTWVGTQIGPTSTEVLIPANNRTSHTVVCSVVGNVFSASIDGTTLAFGGTPPTDASNFLTAAGVVGIGARSAKSSWITGDTPGGGGDTTPPTITGPGGSNGATSSVSVAENTTAVHTFTANESVTWSLNGGADAARFTINSSTGALAFIAAPDFETPNDSDTNNTYVVVVRATDTATPTPNTTDQTVTVTVTDVVEGGDTTNPTLTGSITVSALTSTSYTLTWPVGSDNVAVTGYEVSLNGGTSYAPVGNVLTTNITGRTPGSTDAVRVRAFDAAGNRSTPALSASVTLNAASGTLTLTSPLVNNTGEISGKWANATGIRLSIVNESTGATVLVVTGRATDASGVLTAAITDAAIVTGQTYRILPSWSGNAGISQVLTAT